LITEDLATFRERYSGATDTVVLGDFNARIGNPRTDVHRQVMGRFGEEKSNDAGDEAIDFMCDNDLICLNNRRR
jgi:hypothetical protein